jgi:hypothetical protein
VPERAATAASHELNTRVLGFEVVDEGLEAFTLSRTRPPREDLDLLLA